jgi:hypothetical protein
MLAVTLTISSLVSIMFLIVGFGAGWLAKEHVYKTTPYHPDNLHPEMYDEVGNVIPDQIFAVRFENAEDYDYEDED